MDANKIAQIIYEDKWPILWEGLPPEVQAPFLSVADVILKAVQADLMQAWLAYCAHTGSCVNSRNMPVWVREALDIPKNTKNRRSAAKEV